MIAPPPRPPLFPSPPLSRSGKVAAETATVHAHRHAAALAAAFDRTRERHVTGGRVDDTQIHRHIGNLARSEEHTSELQSRLHLVCRLLLEKKKNRTVYYVVA